MSAAEFKVPGGTRAPSAARELLCETIGRDVPPALLDTARLLVSEIVTNCVIHGGAGESDVITVTCTAGSSGLVTRISHRGPDFTPPDEEPDLLTPGGLGLVLVDQLSQAWGIDSGDEVSVWFRLGRTPAPVSS